MRFTKKKNNSSPHNILYELMLYTEWLQESDLGRSLYKVSEKNAFFFYYLLRPWEYFKKYDSLLDVIANVQNSLLSWNFAIGEVGSVLAILQDSLLEIRTPRDDFSSVVGKATVAKEIYQQWRRLCWSPDSSILAVGSSSGTINFYDLFGSNLNNITLHPGQNKEPCVWSPEYSLAGMFFINARAKHEKWQFELIMVDYGGSLHSYHVSPMAASIREFHQYSFHKAGISSVCWDATHNILIVASTPEQKHLDLKNEPVGWGLSAWRLLNDHPYYRLVVPSPEDLARVEARRGILSWISSLYIHYPFSVVFKMAISPDSQFLACLHSCGAVSVWLLPSLRLHGLWALKDQPDYDIQQEGGEKRTGQQSDFLPIDISWWTEQKVMIARRNGAVSVCELSQLRNMLGETPEFVHGEPRLSPVSTQKGILVLECETISNQDVNNSDEEEQSLLSKSSALLKQSFYLLTDLERYQPRRRRVKTLQRTYRLLGIKSTTPEELFSRKIDAGEFEEALHLAEVYNLDSDRVYQSQWRNSPVSEETISQYLSKISKKRWVFDECHERVPDTLAAAKKLIEFGLSITSLSALLDLTPAGDDDVYESDEDENVILKKQKHILTIPAEDLTDEQKCLILTRRTLLRFSDKLFTYEKIIGSSESGYDREAYDKFRRQPVVQSALELAQQSNHRAVALLFTYQGPEAIPYWLTILSNFPETTSPNSYKELLPECTSEGVIFAWEECAVRGKDWSENQHFDSLEPCEEFLEYNLPPKDEPLTKAVLEEWYRNRVYELELMSNMVDQPLELVRLARERNIKGLEVLYNELVTLDALVYDVGMEDISLRDLEIMSPLQKAEALMSQSKAEDFVECLRHRLIPYLQRCEKYQSIPQKELLSKFLKLVSSKDLSCPLKMFEYCTTEPINSIAQNTEVLMALALDVVYAYTGTDQFDKAESILKTMPSLPIGPFSDRIQTAKNELKVAMILQARGRPLNLLYIHNHRINLETARILFQELASDVGNKVPVAEESDWKELLQDLLQMQSLVFTCVPLDLCYEVYTAGVLASGNASVIRLALHSLCCHSEESHRKPLSLQRSVSLVLTAASQYFDSAASLNDSNISLAKACLNLITEDNAEILEEKDLISALQLLNEFKINLLPMQVRLCAERMKLIESCLTTKPSAYKDYHKLLSLAHKLRICGNDSRQREGTILIRLANIAFEAKDYRYCFEICSQLIDHRHAVGWEPCLRLGQCGQFWDLGARQRLIAFSLVHCPDDKVQELLETRCELEHQQLQISIRDQTMAAETPSEDEEFVDAATSPQSPAKEFLPLGAGLSATFQNTSKLLTQLTNSGFWKDKLLNKEDLTRDKEKKQKPESLMVDQGFPEFYKSLHNRYHESRLSPQYDDEAEGKQWKQYQFMQSLLRASLLEQEKLPKHLLRDIDTVLVQFATLVLPEDSCVGLSTLLALVKPEASEQCFSRLPLTQLTLQLAVYALALRQVLQKHKNAFFWTPDQVVACATADSESLPEVSKLLIKALAQLNNFDQSKHIQELNCGVDVRRFAWDPQYKTDSILGLAMSEEWDKLQAALNLGEAHGVAAWEIVFSHINSLLMSHSPLLSERLSDNRLIQLLKEHPSAVLKRLQENVLPTLSGFDYNQLISYYTVLQTVDVNSPVNGLLPKDHIKLIKKVKATSSEIDYIRLVTRPSEVMEVLRPALRKDTILIISKLLKELLKALPQLQSYISIGNLYMEWAVVQFKTECLNTTCKKPVEQFSGFNTYFQKMTASDLLLFVKKAIFSHQSVLKLDIDTRTTMIDIVLRCGYQQHNQNENPDLLKIQSLRDYIQQVWSLENPSCKTLRNYLVRLDEACGDPDAISTVIQTALVDASVPSHILHKVANLSKKKTLSGYITDLLHSLPSHPALITTVLQRVEDCLIQGEKGDSWSMLIGPLTEKPELPPSVRKQAALISQSLGAHYNEELEALRLRTEAVLQLPVNLPQIADQNSRYLLYKQLLSKAEGWDDLHTLSLLLSSWPHVDTSWYLELVEAMAEVPHEPVFSTLQKIFQKNEFEEEEVAHLISRLDGEVDPIFVITVCLNTKFTRLHLTALQLLKKLPSDTILTCELVKQIAELGLMVDLVGADIFPSLREALLESESDLCGLASEQLRAAGHVAEADILSQAHTNH